jgi:hypothetical protein
MDPRLKVNSYCYRDRYEIEVHTIKGVDYYLPRDFDGFNVNLDTLEKCFPVPGVTLAHTDLEVVLKSLDVMIHRDDTNEMYKSHF